MKSRIVVWAHSFILTTLVRNHSPISLENVIIMMNYIQNSGKKDLRIRIWYAVDGYHIDPKM